MTRAEALPLFTAEVAGEVRERPLEACERFVIVGWSRRTQRWGICTTVLHTTLDAALQEATRISHDHWRGMVVFRLSLGGRG